MTQRFVFPNIQPAPQPGLRGAVIVVAALLAIIVDGSSTSIINAGLPYLQGVTAATPDEGSWILTAFNATYYAFILLSPWLMASFGRKRVLVTALTGFTVVSLVLAATSDYSSFLFLRAVQGACLGSVFGPAVVIFFTSLSPQQITYATPVFILCALSGSTLGTVIGAYTADEFGANMVLVPGGLATGVMAVLVYFAVNVKEPTQRLRFDFVGVALSIGMFGSLQYLSNEGERRNWFDDSTVVLGAWALAFCTITFVLYELFVTADPHVDLRMFAKYRNLMVGSLINIILGGVGYSVTLFVAYLQTAISATPTFAGSIVLIRLITYVFGVFAAFMLARLKILDLRGVVITGAAGTVIGFFAFANNMTTTADASAFVVVSLAFGFFFSMMSQPIGALVVGSMPLPMLAAGVSIYKLTSPVGLMIATGAVQTLLDHRTASARALIVADVVGSRPAVAHYVAAHGAGGLASLVGVQSQVLAYAFAMQLFAIVLIPVFGLVFFAQIKK